jgi:hypothetical protein
MGGHNRTYPSLRWVGMDDDRLPGGLACLMLIPGVGPIGPFATIIERSMSDRLLRLVLSCVSLRASLLFWHGPINGWRWRIWSVHCMTLGVWQENCFERPCINNLM